MGIKLWLYRMKSRSNFSGGISWSFIIRRLIYIYIYSYEVGKIWILFLQGVFFFFKNKIWLYQKLDWWFFTSTMHVKDINTMLSYICHIWTFLWKKKWYCKFFMVKKWTKIFVGMKSKLCQFYKKEKLSLGWLLWDEVKIYNKSTIILNLSQSLVLKT